MSRIRIFEIALVAGAAFINLPKGHAEMTVQPAAPATARQNHPYVGMWVTADGYVRHNLLPNSRYDEARGNRESAYRGRYEVRGDDIFYWDDTGFTADGRFVGDVLYHGGMVFHRAR
ncbi:Atu4866 domain-containing protein [Roseomonas xinghualingensis]|uniref:Atu4866 domain-containing protein n=1 Tax=Roseomonas xinghualingensis TaxID=2986475 RepID=UPI0021F1140C|nr:Atu4866 domain-containing protein [Roseomonas sp. SXEYE001]MCV4206934.1 Atu4866 domain-containing protein [Roseomonas sp. SXEYE001]